MTYKTVRSALLLLLLAWLSACTTLRTERVVNFEESIPASDLETIVLKNPTGFNLSDSRFHMPLGQYRANNVDVSGWSKTKFGPINKSIENDILDNFLINGKLRLDFRSVEVQEKSLTQKHYYEIHGPQNNTVISSRCSRTRVIETESTKEIFSLEPETGKQSEQKTEKQRLIGNKIVCEMNHKEEIWTLVIVSDKTGLPLIQCQNDSNDAFEFKDPINASKVFFDSKTGEQKAIIKENPQYEEYVGSQIIDSSGHLGNLIYKGFGTFELRINQNQPESKKQQLLGVVYGIALATFIDDTWIKTRPGFP